MQTIFDLVFHKSAVNFVYLTLILLQRSILFIEHPFKSCCFDSVGVAYTQEAPKELIRKLKF